MAKTGDTLSVASVALPEIDLEEDAKGSAEVKEVRRSKEEVALGRKSCFENSSVPYKLKNGSVSWGGVLGELDEERLDGARPESGDWLLVDGAANISRLKKSSNELKGT
jgi:glutaredoxin